MSVDRAELLVAAGNAFLAGALSASQLRRAAVLRPDRHDPSPLSLLADTERLVLAAPDRVAALVRGAWQEWTPQAEFDGGRWLVTWRSRPIDAPPPSPSVAGATTALASDLDVALAALPPDAREARILLTARATLRGEASPTASPIRRLRARQAVPRAPRANTIAGGVLPAAYPEPARRLYRAAVESELATSTARAAALASLP